MDCETKYTPGWMLPDQATTLESDFGSITSSIPTKIQTKPSKIDRVRPFNDNAGFHCGFTTTEEKDEKNDFHTMTLEKQIQQYDEECNIMFHDIDPAKVISVPPGMFDTFDTDDEFTATAAATTTTTNIESPMTTITDTTDTNLITETPNDIPTANIPPIASSPTETKIRPEFNTDAESTATTTTTTTTEEEEEEEEEVRTIIDHEVYPTCDRTNKESDTAMTATTIEDEFTTSTTTDIPNIMENTTTVPTTDTVPPIDSTPAKTRNLPKTLAEMMIPPELREALAQACAPLAKLFDANTAEYVFETYIKDPFFDDEVARELVSGILFDRAVACEVRNRIMDCNSDIVYNAEMNRPPPTNTKIQPTMTINKTVTPPKDRPVSVISNKKTKKTKKKHKQATPPKTKTIHEIKRPIVTVEEVNRYLQHVQNNPDLDEFPMNNLPIRTQIAQCEVAYYKFWNTIPGLAE